MDKMENILYSLIPLVIIVFISWLFSFLASKRRKEQDGVETEHESARTQFLQFLSNGDEIEEETATEQDMRRTDALSYDDRHNWTPDVPQGGPEVTPKPIEPKWWGS